MVIILFNTLFFLLLYVLNVSMDNENYMIFFIALFLELILYLLHGGYFYKEKGEKLKNKKIKLIDFYLKTTMFITFSLVIPVEHTVKILMLSILILAFIVSTGLLLYVYKDRSPLDKPTALFRKFFYLSLSNDEEFNKYNKELIRNHLLLEKMTTMGAFLMVIDENRIAMVVIFIAIATLLLISCIKQVLVYNDGNKNLILLHRGNIVKVIFILVEYITSIVYGLMSEGISIGLLPILIGTICAYIVVLRNKPKSF